MNILQRMQELETKMSLLEDKLLELTHNVLTIKNQNTALRLNLKSRQTKLVEQKICKYCGGNIDIRNPTGKCDHLYYPENINN